MRFLTMLKEAARVDTSTFEGAHGKKPKGSGRWMFTKEKWGIENWSKAVEGEDYVIITDTYAKAAKQAAKWANGKGLYVVYVAS